MHRLQLAAHGEPLDTVELHDVDEPDLGSDEVLVEMEAAPINPSDLMLIRGSYRVQPAFPFALGSEGVGRVVKSGSGVSGAVANSRVLILPNNEQGTWAGHVVVSERNLVPLEGDADPVQLSMIGINALTAFLLLRCYVSLMPGDWIAQTAANSGMGEYVVRLAKLCGVRTLNVVRRSEAAARVREFGGDSVVLEGDELHRDIEAVLGERRLKLVLDCVGGPTTGELAGWLEPSGSIASYGVQNGQSPALSPYTFIFRSLHIHGFSIANHLRDTPSTEIRGAYRTLADLVAEGSLSASVDSSFPLSSFRDAFSRSEQSGRSGKVIFDLSE